MYNRYVKSIFSMYETDSFIQINQNGVFVNKKVSRCSEKNGEKFSDAETDGV